MAELYVMSAFSKDNKGGNKAGVVLNGEHLASGQRLEIAKKLGYSETVFVLDSDPADFKLQYYTPEGEVPLCGHATIAAFSALRLSNMLDRQNYTIETQAGILKIQIKENGLIFMEQNCPAYFDVLAPSLFEACIEEEFIDRAFPIQIVSTGLKDILLPVDSREHLAAISPDFEKMKELSREKDVIGVHAFSLLNDSDATAICRNFAPLYGINEESATGTSNCALACYLFKYYQKKSQYIFEQGYNMGEPSRIIVNLSYHGNIIDSVYVGGYGYLIDYKTLPLYSSVLFSPAASQAPWV